MWCDRMKPNPKHSAEGLGWKRDLKMNKTTHYCEECGKFFETEKDRIEHITNTHAGKQRKLTY